LYLLFYYTLKTRYRQRFREARQKSRGPENLVKCPGKFIVPPVFNFYFNPCLLLCIVVQYDSDISAYTVERTMDMENRIKTMREWHAHAVKRRTSLPLSVTALFDCCGKNDRTRRALGRAHLPPTTVFRRLKTTRHCCDGPRAPNNHARGIFPT